MNKHNHYQGFYTEQIEAYANLKIKEEDAGRVNCASFKSLNYVCKFIAVNEGVPATKVYPALRYIGYNYRYADMKNITPDPLHKLGSLVEECILTTNPYLIKMATEDIDLFGHTTKSVYRIKKDAIAVAMKDSEVCGVSVAELNLYNALEGLDVVVSNEPDYMLLRDRQIFEETLETYDRIKQSIHKKMVWLNGMLPSK